MEGIKNKHPKINIENITPKKGHYFFGFYDVTPWDKSEKYVLAHKTNFIDQMPKSSDETEVGYINIENRSFQSLDKTTAWNFQQGARLQWLPNHENKVIYNKRFGGHFGSVIYNINSKESKELSHPIYTLSPKENIALSLNFSRLQRLGGYGYAGFEDKHKDEPAPEQDGIFKIDLNKNTKELIISISKVANFEISQKNNSHHYVTHPTFNSSGTRFCFLHRFGLEDGGWYTRLLTANPDGSELFVVAEGTLSHFDWFDDNHILIWGRSRSYLTKARKYRFFTLPIFRPILNLLRKQVRGFIRHKIIGDQYLLFKDRIKESKSVGVGILTEDGHPTRFDDTPWLITDTYPDKNHYHSLILYNIEKNKRINLAKFYSIPSKEYIKKYKGNVDWDLSGMRSDLHPRWNRNGDKICIDSVHEGKKNINIIGIKEIIDEYS